MNKNVHCVIMGGGRGTRLQPLTKLRCKPAVPLAGKYRLVDIPLSNCINSGFNQIHLLTQFNTASLHRHIQQSFQFDAFGGGFVEILSAEQTELSNDWYQGTADAVRQNLHHFHMSKEDIFVILSGDQLYSMDLRKLVEQHIEKKADVTIAAKAIPRHKMSAFGAMQVKNDLSIVKFVEKPRLRKDTQGLVISESIKKKLHQKTKIDYCLASMGIYVFNASTLKKALESHGTDFGKEIIPSLLGKVKMHGYLYDGYWEDIGTVKSFFEANLMLTDPIPAFNFFDSEAPIYTHTRHLPASKLNSCTTSRTIVADGCILTQAKLERCVIGIRSSIGVNSKLKNVIMMGADRYETLDEIVRNKKKKKPNLGIGEHCIIENAIIDKDARIGNHVVLTPKGKKNDYEKNGIYVKDGIVCVQKGCVIADNTVI